MAESKIPLAAIVGPTASGKTSLAVAVCKALGGEAVSCDSMQIYKGMDIATAKPTEAEMQRVPHHLIGFLDPSEPFSVADYCALASEAIRDIHSRGRQAVLVGGTGLYYSSLVDNIEFLTEKSDIAYREFLKGRAERDGAQVLLDELAEIDPKAASELHPNNLGRVIRALELYHTTGKTKSFQNEESKKTPSPFDLRAVCLDAHDRQVLYDRINLRVAKQAIGYKELYPYFAGERTLDKCVEQLKMQTRRYAKRQLTWFRRDERIKFLYIDDYDTPDGLLNAALAALRGE